MSIYESFYLFKYGDTYSRDEAELNSSTEVHWSDECKLFDENGNYIGSLGKQLDDDDGYLVQVVINDDSFEKDNYEEVLITDLSRDTSDDSVNNIGQPVQELVITRATLNRRDG